MPRGKKSKYTESDSEENSDGADSISSVPEDDGGEYGSRKKGKKAAAKKKGGAGAKPAAPRAKRAKPAAKAADDAHLPVAAVPAAAAAPAATPAVASHSGVPTPGDEAIQKNMGMSSYLRGSEYYESKKLQPAAVTVSGKTLTAKLKGHGPEEYSLEVALQSSDAWTAKCSCPVGAEGKCKHIACLLFVWQEMQTGVRKERGKRSPSVQALVDAKAEELMALSVPDLKAMLKANDQSTSGAKADLLERCAYGLAFGALPRCPKCSGGKLKERGLYIVCPGFMDDDTFHECDFFAEKIEHNPWKKA